MSKLARRSSGSLDVIDTAIGVAAVVVVAVIALNVIGWVAGIVFFAVKLAIFALIVAVAIRFLSGRRNRNSY
jgi:hypothetical protein